MRDFTVDETILAVKAFEKVMAQANCSVKHYHANNGAFAHKGFLDEVNLQGPEDNLLRLRRSSPKRDHQKQEQDAYSLSLHFALAWY